MVDGAVEESLRYVGPVDTGLARVTTEDLDVGGVRILHGDTENVVSPRPDELDVRRVPGGRLAFG